MKIAQIESVDIVNYFGVAVKGKEVYLIETLTDDEILKLDYTYIKESEVKDFHKFGTYYLKWISDEENLKEVRNWFKNKYKDYEQNY